MKAKLKDVILATKPRWS